jgi:cell division protein ZapE
MIADPSAAAGGSDTIRLRYLALAGSGAIEDDRAQRQLLDRLAHLARALEDSAPHKQSRIGRLLARKTSAAPRGLYIHGPVGRGKTMLMNLFFDSVSIADKRRAHFHEFMADVHERVHAWRTDNKHVRPANGADDPILPVADALAREERLLCFDEFAVHDIADAMILGRLFTRLFDSGVVLVATSNVAPDELYAGGLNRQLFLPFIDLLQRNVEVARLEARTDFRLEKLALAPLYVTPLGAEADRALDAAWRHLTATERGAPVTLRLLGRDLVVPQAAKGVARFTFAELCEAPLAAADYAKIARDFHTIVVDRIPILDATRRNEAKRFINLIDILYDHRVKLLASAAAEPDALFAGSVGPEAEESARAASRLFEMRSHEYMGAAHGAAPSAKTA